MKVSVHNELKIYKLKIDLMDGLPKRFRIRTIEKREDKLLD